MRVDFYGIFKTHSDSYYFYYNAVSDTHFAIMVDARQLTKSQSIIFQKIIEYLTKPSEIDNVFLVHGAAGTGKTFLLNHILAHCESKNIKAIAIAYTGIASCLLKKGKTVHSQFRIPWNHKHTNCMLHSTHPMYTTIKNASVLLWDQAALCSNQIFEEVDHFLRFMMQSKQLFGGKLVVICGDFNECLPIVRKTKSTPAESHSLLYSDLFRQMQSYTLQENYRFKHEADYKFCMEIGCGNNSKIAIPSQVNFMSYISVDSTTFLIKQNNFYHLVPCIQYGNVD